MIYIDDWAADKIKANNPTKFNLPHPRITHSLSIVAERTYLLTQMSGKISRSPMPCLIRIWIEQRMTSVKVKSLILIKRHKKMLPDQETKFTCMVWQL